MKSLSYLLLLVASLFTLSVQAQKTEKTIKVWGNCGMCKNTIDKAALEAGAQKADWNTETKMLKLVYNAKNTNVDKIQKAIAAVGYDNEAYTAPDEVYNKLHFCCKYDRKAADQSMVKCEKCQNGEKCEKCAAGEKCEKCAGTAACENCTDKEKCENCKKEKHHVMVTAVAACCDSKVAA